MYGATAETFLGVRIPKELESKLIQAAEKLNKQDNRWYDRWNKSKFVRRILEEFFGGKNELRKSLDKAAGKNVKQPAGRRGVKQ